MKLLGLAATIALISTVAAADGTTQPKDPPYFGATETVVKFPGESTWVRIRAEVRWVNGAQTSKAICETFSDMELTKPKTVKGLIAGLMAEGWSIFGSPTNDKVASKEGKSSFSKPTPVMAKCSIEINADHWESPLGTVVHTPVVQPKPETASSGPN